MKAVCRVLAAGLLLAALAGCGAGRGGYEWAVKPRLKADKIEPLAVSGGGILEGSLPEEEALRTLCAAQQGELWGLVDGQTGEWVVEPCFSQAPALCPAGHLLATGPDGTLIDDPELDRQLTAYAPALRLEPGHGGPGVEYVWDGEAGQVRRHSWNESGAQSPLLDPSAGSGELLPIRQGSWKYSQLEGAQVMEAQPKSLYAVASADGTLLTDFVYEQARQRRIDRGGEEGEMGLSERTGPAGDPLQVRRCMGPEHRPGRSGQRQRRLAAGVARALPRSRRGGTQRRGIRSAEQRRPETDRLRRLSGTGPGAGRPCLGRRRRSVGAAAAGFRFLSCISSHTVYNGRQQPV